MGPAGWMQKYAGTAILIIGLSSKSSCAARLPCPRREVPWGRGLCHFLPLLHPEPGTQHNMYLLSKRRKESGPRERHREGQGRNSRGRLVGFHRGLQVCLWLVMWGEATFHMPLDTLQPPHDQALRRRPPWHWEASGNSPGCPRFPLCCPQTLCQVTSLHLRCQCWALKSCSGHRYL